MSHKRKQNKPVTRTRVHEPSEPESDDDLPWYYRAWLFLRFPALAVAVIVGALIWLTSENPDRLFQEAQAVMSKDPAQAEQLLERCLTARPNFPEAQLLRCRLLGILGHWDAAQGMFLMIKNSRELSGPALLDLARHAMAAGQFPLAGLAAMSARGKDSSRIASLELLQQLALQQGLVDQAYALSRELSELTPDDYRNALSAETNSREQQRLRVELARKLISQGDLAAAREAIQPCLDEQAPSTDVRLVEASIERLEGRTAKALQILDPILAEHPKLVQALFLRGLSYFDEGRWQPARDDLVEVTRLQPRQDEAFFKLGQVYQRMGDVEKAEAMLAISRKRTEDTEELAKLFAEMSQGPLDDAKTQRYRQLIRERAER